MQISKGGNQIRAICSALEFVQCLTTSQIIKQLLEHEADSPTFPEITPLAYKTRILLLIQLGFPKGEKKK